MGMTIALSMAMHVLRGILTCEQDASGHTVWHNNFTAISMVRTIAKPMPIANQDLGMFEKVSNDSKCFKKVFKSFGMS